jgi:uncharacterized protein
MAGTSIAKAIDIIGGAFADDPGSVRLSQGAQDLIDFAYQDIPLEEFRDYHVHLVGTGTQGTGAYVNDRMESWLHPIERLKFLVMASGSGVRDLGQADRQYLERLLTLIRYLPARGKIGLLAFDRNYLKDGSYNHRQTQIYVPNGLVVDVANAFPDYIFPIISIHPYRKDALQELDYWAERGVKMVKWLPNAQGMNPADKKCFPFYRKMIEHGMVLLNHCGKETAITAVGHQYLGNPLYVRKPLDMGLRVVVAHCATMGYTLDLEHPLRKPTHNVHLFYRLMEDPAYEGLLFGDLAAVTQINRSGSPLKTVLERTEFHHRLVNGSDYPLPAVNAVISTNILVQQRLITARERQFLREIYRFNPLVFDVVLKRALKHPQTGARFPASVFLRHPDLGI